MGQTLMGGVKNVGNADFLTPQQKSFLSSAMGGLEQMGSQVPPEQYEQMFQKSFIDPAQQVLQRQIIPSIKEGFMGLDEAGSSALNQALAQSATDLSTSLGSQMMNQYNAQEGRRLSALSGLGSLATARTYEPMIQQTQGILGPLISGTGQVGSSLLKYLLK